MKSLVVTGAAVEVEGVGRRVVGILGIVDNIVVDTGVVKRVEIGAAVEV